MKISHNIFGRSVEISVDEINYLVLSCDGEDENGFWTKFIKKILK